MKRISVGGPMVGTRRCGGGTLAPLVVGVDSSQRFILLPGGGGENSSVAVLAYQTGKPVATLQVDGRICSVVNNDDNDVVLVGCQDGTLREFATKDLASKEANAVIKPRRTYRIAKEKYSVVHLTVVAPTSVAKAGRSDISAVLYVLLMSNKSKKGSFHGILVRVLVPSQSQKEEDFRNIDLTDKAKGLIETLDTFNFCKDENGKVAEGKEPFALSVVTTPPRADSYYQPSDDEIRDSVFVVLASPISLTVYYDPLGITMKEDKVGKYSKLIKVVALDHTIRPQDPLSCIQISPSKTDIVCGHASGTIRVLINVLSLTQEYVMTMHCSSRAKRDMNHPTRHTLIRKVHWHAHPVASMTYDCKGGSDAMLYSGGEESVLVTWQLARGIYRPANLLPRICLGAILHILYISGQSTGPRGGPDSILVYCSDNSLQLFQSHNFNLIWRVQGLATSGEHLAILPSHGPIMALDRRKAAVQDAIILAGLSGAPGYIHWYNPKKQSVVTALEVAPFNRVSRTEATDTPMPSPTITHAVWSLSGSDLVTIDVVPTENLNVGSQLEAESGAMYGAVSTARFWSAVSGGSSKPYEMVAAMSYPHGSSNEVSAVALSADGQYACTVSNDEKAFRLWRRGDHTKQDRGQQNERKSSAEKLERSEWVCRCKVTIPSGYSNVSTGRSAVSFSPDASVLAIAFGGTVTMWDHHAVTLLTSLRHGVNDSTGVVHSVEFLESESLADVLLIKSAMCVALRSPYGNRGAKGFGWDWTLPKSLEKSVRVSCADFLSSSNLVAIALYSEQKGKSRVLLVDALSGETCRSLREASPVIDNISGEIISMISKCESAVRQGMIGDGNKSIPLCLYVLTDKGEMIALDNTESKRETVTSKTFVVDETPEIPSLPLLSSSEHSTTKKRKLSVLSASDLEEPAAKGLSLEHFGGVIGEDEEALAPRTELPLLRGAFSRAFVSRHLHRREGD